MLKVTRTWPSGKQDKKYSLVHNAIAIEGCMNPGDIFINILVHDFKTKQDNVDCLIVPRDGKVELELV